ncbi:MAG: hypothetical protein IT556_04140 [Acetobacteraceae bacterium]|nr:hypothetical protein [Acetobacteraceae bacterium]
MSRRNILGARTLGVGRAFLRGAGLAAACLFGALLAAPASAQPTAWPEALRGTWALGECSAPAVLLQVNARGIARLPETGEQRYTRLLRFAQAGDWVVGIGEGEHAPRLMLRGRDGGLDLAEPPAKLLDSELPGAGTPVASFRRCTTLGGALASLHGEGIALAAALDGLEAACDGELGNSDGCTAALMGFADVGKDGKLGTAELARLVRAVTWLVLTGEGVPLEVLAAGVGASGGVGVAVAWLLVANYDYDGDGRLSPAEMAQDRGPWSGGTPPATPSRPTARLLPGLGGLSGAEGPLHDLIQGLGPLLQGLGRQ